VNANAGYDYASAAITTSGRTRLSTATDETGRLAIVTAGDRERASTGSFDGDSLHDGCRWLGIKTLIARDARSFAYDHSQQILSCEPGPTPRKTRSLRCRIAPRHVHP
jgi:hypothetical protein